MGVLRARFQRRLGRMDRNTYSDEEIRFGLCDIEFDLTDSVSSVDETHDAVFLADLDNLLPWHTDPI